MTHLRYGNRGAYAIESGGVYDSSTGMFRTSDELREKNKGVKYVAYPFLAATLCTGTVLAADDMTGFVPPPADRKLPPPPPRTSSSAETLDCCSCCPVTPMTRTEAKKPPKPPVIVVKLRH